MPLHKIPGLYVEEIPQLAPSITSAETAIPTFIGYTEKAQDKEPGDLKNKPWRIEAMIGYETSFGYAEPEQAIEITFNNSGNQLNVTGKINPELQSPYLMYYSLQIFFANGGGPCWIVSVGDYTTYKQVIRYGDLKRGLGRVGKIDDITLLLFPDSINLSSGFKYYALYKKAIEQCVKLRDRFTLMDVFHNRKNNISWKADIEFLRNTLSGDADQLKYGAAYFPKIYTQINFQTTDELVKVVSIGAGDLPATLAELNINNNAYYVMAKSAVNDTEMLLPASPAVAGIYSQNDNNRGVWKAPANINIDQATRPEYLITDEEQQELNVDPLSGKSINVIRTFPGRGPAIIWGARTLAGNDNEWRYISILRYSNMIEESIKKATGQFVFEANDINTWTRIKSMIENYLIQQWKSGALMGTKPNEAFFVQVGLGTTMTEQDILDGSMIVEIGMAVVRPAEFIILLFKQNMLPKS